MTAEREGLADIVRVLRSRLPQLLADEYGEGPDDWMELGSTRRISAHLADALADLLAARDRRVRGEALREAAAEWGSNDARSRAVSGWLREHAARIEADA